MSSTNRRMRPLRHQRLDAIAGVFQALLGEIGRKLLGWWMPGRSPLWF